MINRPFSARKFDEKVQPVKPVIASYCVRALACILLVAHTPLFKME